MRKRIGLFFMATLCFMLTSCAGEEPNDIGYITALGIDKTDDGYSYTIQFANPTKISGGAAEQGGSGGNIVENIVVDAPTVYAAINNANAIVSKDLSLSHAKVIVISEEIARKGVFGITDVIARNNEIRPDVYLAVAENAGDYLEGVKPVVELNPVKYYQLTYENKKGGFVPQNTASDFYMACVAEDRDFALPLSGVAQAEEKSTGTDAGSGGEQQASEKPSPNKKNKEAITQTDGFENGKKNYFAGEAGAEVKNKSETIGLAVFKGDTYTEKLGSIDAEIYNILMNNINGSRVTFYADNENNIPITVSLESKKRPAYKINRDTKKVEILLSLEAELVSAPQKHKEEKTYMGFEKDASKMINDAVYGFIEKTYKGLDVDLLAIKSKLKKQFLTNDKYYEYINLFVPKEWDFTVNTELKLKRTGMTYYY